MFDKPSSLPSPSQSLPVYQPGSAEDTKGPVTQKFIKRQLSGQNDSLNAESNTDTASKSLTDYNIEQLDFESVEASLVFKTCNEYLLDQMLRKGEDEPLTAISEDNESTDDTGSVTLRPDPSEKFFAGQDPESGLTLIRPLSMPLPEPEENEPETGQPITHSVVSTSGDESSDDEDDAVFFSATPSLTASMVPTPVRKSSPQRDKAWNHLTGLINKSHDCRNPAWIEGEDLKAALSAWITTFPAATNPEKVVSTLQHTATKIEKAEDLIPTLQDFMDNYLVAEQLHHAAPEKILELKQDPKQILETLLIFRQKLVAETPEEDYERTVKKLDTFISQQLVANHADKFKAATGFDMSPEQMDYTHFRRLASIAGSSSPHDRLDHYIVEFSRTREGYELGHLIQMDLWLSDDKDQPNAVVYLLGNALMPDFQKSATRLGLAEEPAQPKPEDISTSVKTGQQEARTESDKGKRVRFKDQPEVVPAQEARQSTGAKIEDIVPLSRGDMASHISVQYFDLLQDYLHDLEKRAHGDADASTLLFHFRGQAESVTELMNQANQIAGKYRNGVPPKIQQQCEKLYDQAEKKTSVLMSELDPHLARFDPERAGPVTGQARTDALSQMSYVQSGLVDKTEFINDFHNLTGLTVVKSLMPRRSQAFGNHITTFEDMRTPEELKLYETKEGEATMEARYKPPKRRSMREAPPPPSYMRAAKRLRGYPKTSDILGGLNKLTKAYHQAMETDLSTPVNFCKSLLAIESPQIMLALRVRMENEKVPGVMVNSWAERMQEIMLLQVASRVTTQVAGTVAGRMGKKYQGDPRPMYQKMDLREDATQETLTQLSPMDYQINRQTDEMIREESFRFLDQFNIGKGGDWIANSGVDPRLEQMWINGLNKPAEWDDNFKNMMAKYLPSPRQLGHYLVANNMLPKERYPKRL